MPLKNCLSEGKRVLHTDNGNFVQIIPFLESLPDTEAKWILVPEYIAAKRFNDAETTLNGFQKDNMERQKKDEYYRVHIALGNTNRIPTDMTVAEKTTVDAVSTSETEIKYNAQAMLHFWFKEQYPPELAVLGTSSKMAGTESEKITDGQIPAIFANDNENLAGKLYPNPANNKLMMSYQLKENKTGWLEIYDIIGKLIIKQELLWDTYYLEINAERLNNGVYFYETLIDGKPVVKDKLLIIKQ